ncbi:MAG: hypothetical protein ACRENG_00580 [bacterium]
MKTYCTALFTALTALALFHSKSVGKTHTVDKSGLGQFLTIQAAVTAAQVNDTVKVFPGDYNEQVVISKYIVLQGSGYEYTRIIAAAAPAVKISVGKIMWFAISSKAGYAVDMSGGKINNCVVWNSPGYGIYFSGSANATAIVQNCTVVNNNRGYDDQIYAYTNGLTVVNTIVWTFPSGNSDRDYITGNNVGILHCRTHNKAGTQGISDDPEFFSSSDLRLVNTSPCIDKGSPDLNDPDGSLNDLGYYGGPEAPIAPVVTQLRISINPNGTVNVQATAQSTY